MAAEDSPLFADVLRRLRLAAGLTQEELAEQARLSVRAISDLERGARRAPRRETVQLLATALQLSKPDRAALEAAARQRTATTLPDAPGLPQQPTPLLGRESLLATAAARLCNPDVRLLTLTGPGGVGKTRVALELAARLAATFAHGVCFVPLTPIGEAGLVGATIAQALGLREADNRSPQTALMAYLRERELLLLLDNFEHVIAATPLVVELLAGCPRLKILLTSRMVLRVRGEHEYAVPPLELPAAEPALDAASLLQSPAAQLFVRQAQAVWPDFQLTPAMLPAVAGICIRLEGLPLALELAAARVKLFPPSALLARLAHRLEALTGGPRDLPERQQTMRGTIAWSYDLLDRQEQALFRRLAVFAGGWTLQAAGEVCQIAEAGGASSETVELLSMLVDHSMVQVRHGPGEAPWAQPRFSMLETLREFGLEQLAAAGEREALERRHALYYMALAEEAEAALLGPSQIEWLDIVESDLDNARAALRWALESETPARQGPGTDETAAALAPVEVGLRVAAALWRFWHAHGRLSEGCAWIERLLERAGTAGAPAWLRAKGRTWAALLAVAQGDYARALRLAEAGLALYQGLNDRRGRALGLTMLGLIAREQGDYARAASLHEESLALHKEADDAWGMAVSLNNLGLVARDLEDYSRAARFYEESMTFLRRLGDTWSIALTLGNLGEVTHDRGDFARAAQLYAESLRLTRALGDKQGMAYALNSLAIVERAQGNYARSEALYAESLELYRGVEDKWGSAACLEGVAGVASMQGQWRRAARLFGAAAALREAIGAPLPPADRAAYERDTTAVRAALGDEQFAAVWAEGRMLPPTAIDAGTAEP